MLWTFPLALLLQCPIGLGFSFSFISMYILISFFISSVICRLFWSMLFSFHMLEFLIVPPPPLPIIEIQSYCIVVRKDDWNDFNFFFNFPRPDLWPRMWSILEKFPCALEKNVKLIVLGWNAFHMTQQSHFWAYTPRKPDLKETHAPQCSSQHCLS